MGNLSKKAKGDKSNLNFKMSKSADGFLMFYSNTLYTSTVHNSLTQNWGQFFQIRNWNTPWILISFYKKPV